MKRHTATAAAMLALVALSALLMRHFAPADSMRIEIRKAARTLEFHDGRGGVRTYRIALGFRPEGPKTAEGDGATPEGDYFVCVKNPKSAFHLSLGLSYPGPADADRGLATGSISPAAHADILRAHAERRTPPWKTALGGEIFIHGHGAARDWTAGCIALEDGDMTELYASVATGTPVSIRP